MGSGPDIGMSESSARLLKNSSFMTHNSSFATANTYVDNPWTADCEETSESEKIRLIRNLDHRWLDPLSYPRKKEAKGCAAMQKYAT